MVGHSFAAFNGGNQTDLVFGRSAGFQRQAVLLSKRPFNLIVSSSIALKRPTSCSAWNSSDTLRPNARTSSVLTVTTTPLPCRPFSFVLWSLAEHPTHLGVYTRGNVGCIDEMFTTR